MKPQFNALMRKFIHFSSCDSPPFTPPIFRPRLFFTTIPTFLSSSAAAVEKVGSIGVGNEIPPNNCTELLRAWGCTDDDISQIFQRLPSLHRAKPSILQSKLNLLTQIGLNPPDLVKIVICRPRFLNCRISRCFEERLQYLESLFGSREVLHRVIVRNPSVLIYDLQTTIKPIVEAYTQLGLSKKDLTFMLLSRPTIIPRTSMDAEKLELISRTGVCKNSKMYKYVATLIGISRLDTIREKIANLAKFGFSEDEVLRLFGYSPLVLTLSVDKVQRNMTFVLGTMKLPASVILRQPFLLFANLETLLKPRVLLAGKMHEMGLEPEIKGDTIFTALRMTEKRFIKAFINCHPKDVAEELMGYYTNAKHVKRLAESSKKNHHKGFPF